MSRRMDSMHRVAGPAPHPQGPLPSQGVLQRLKSRDSDPRQLQSHGHFSGLLPQGIDRQPHHASQSQHPQGLSNFQHHQIQQAYNALMHHKQQLPPEEATFHPQTCDPPYPLQPVPSRPGPNNMLGLPGYRPQPSITPSDLDTIMKLKQQLSGLSSFMQAHRSSDQRAMPGTSLCMSLCFSLSTCLCLCLCQYVSVCVPLCVCARWCGCVLCSAAGLLQ